LAARDRSLAVVAPFLASQWHPSLNRGRSAATTPVSSSGLVWWLGWCGHAWQESPSRRARTGAGCPVCTGERTRPGINDLATTDPGLAARWDRWAAVRVPELTSRDVNADCGWLRRMLADQHAATDGSTPGPQDPGEQVGVFHPRRPGRHHRKAQQAVSCDIQNGRQRRSADAVVGHQAQHVHRGGIDLGDLPRIHHRHRTRSPVRPGRRRTTRRGLPPGQTTQVVVLDKSAQGAARRQRHLPAGAAGRHVSTDLVDQRRRRHGAAIGRVLQDRQDGVGHPHIDLGRSAVVLAMVQQTAKTPADVGGLLAAQRARRHCDPGGVQLACLTSRRPVLLACS